MTTSLNEVGRSGDQGASPAATGLSPSVEPASGLAGSAASIPSAMFSPMVYQSCPICHGSREAFGVACSTCADPDPAVARRVLEQLRADQMRFLRAFRHTLANQPVTADEWDEFALCEYWVENDDGVDDPDNYDWLIPPTKVWFASSQASFRYGSIATFIRYNPLGLLLRECLMAGADAMVPPPASAMSAGTAETAQQAQGDSPPARPEGDAQPTPESKS